MDPKYYGAAADYNQPKRFGLGRIFIIIGLVFGLVIVLSIGVALVNSLGSGERNDLATLIAREQQLQKFIDENIDSISSSELRKISSDALLYTSTDAVALGKLLKSVYGQSGVPDDITKRETDTTSVSELQSAAQINRFDSTYHRLFGDKIAAARELAIKVRDQNAALKDTAEQAIKNLDSLESQLKPLTF